MAIETVCSYREVTRAGGTCVAVPAGERNGQRDVGHWEGSRFIRHSEDRGTEYAGVLRGHFAVFDQWTEINSRTEGRFMERLARGCFENAFEDRTGIRCLFQHGHDPICGDKPLGPIRELEEDDHGARYVVDLFPTTYVRELLPGLKDGVYGCSFRFRVEREEVRVDPPRSQWNPEGIEERTIMECSISEFSPVTFPAYAAATAIASPRSKAPAHVAPRHRTTRPWHLTRRTREHHRL